mgnify:CR=1 FL=1
MNVIFDVELSPQGEVFGLGAAVVDDLFQECQVKFGALSRPTQPINDVGWIKRHGYKGKESFENQLVYLEPFPDVWKHFHSFCNKNIKNTPNVLWIINNKSNFIERVQVSIKIHNLQNNVLKDISCINFLSFFWEYNIIHNLIGYGDYFEDVSFEHICKKMETEPAVWHDPASRCEAMHHSIRKLMRGHRRVYESYYN